MSFLTRCVVGSSCHSPWELSAITLLSVVVFPKRTNSIAAKINLLQVVNHRHDLLAVSGINLKCQGYEQRALDSEQRS